MSQLTEALAAVELAKSNLDATISSLHEHTFVEAGSDCILKLDIISGTPIFTIEADDEGVSLTLHQMLALKDMIIKKL